MNFFIDEAALKQAGARDLLNSLPDDFPGMREARITLANGGYVGAILRRAWEALVRDDAKFKFDMLVLRSENTDMHHQLANYRLHPLATDLRNVQTALQESAAQIKTGEATIAQLRAELDAERRQSTRYQRQIKKLEDVIGDLKRLTAQQHNQLASFLGDA
jgi:septal ring factor EnvC (AmiA/AmiB activator)